METDAVPFIPIINGRGKAPALPAIVRFYIAGQKQLCFKVGRGLASEMGWHVGDRIAVTFGVGEDAGKVSLSKIVRHDAGNTLAHFGRGWLLTTVTIPQVIGGMTRQQIVDGLPSTIITVSHERINDTLTLDMPRLRLRVVAGA